MTITQVKHLILREYQLYDLPYSFLSFFLDNGFFDVTFSQIFFDFYFLQTFSIIFASKIFVPCGFQDFFTVSHYTYYSSKTPKQIGDNLEKKSAKLLYIIRRLHYQAHLRSIYANGNLIITHQALGRSIGIIILIICKNMFVKN